MLNPFKKEKEIIYIDKLSKYRKAKVGEFNMFDKVIVDKLYYPSTDKKLIGKEGIVVDCYKQTDGGVRYYVLFLGDNSPVPVYGTIKPYYGEFQEEFEALDEVQRIQLEVSAKQQRLKELLPKLDKIKDKNFTQL